MSAPRLEIDLARVHHNARTLVDRLARHGISVTGVTKATLGAPEIAREMIRAGVGSIGESRIENIEAMRLADLSTTMTLVRSPMISQADRVVANADVSLNTELDVISELSDAAVAQRRHHAVVLMVELGDLREGILPAHLGAVAERTLDFPNIELRGIGANLACQSGIAPDTTNMAELSSLVTSLEARFDIALPLVTGGNSANLRWALSGADVGRINDLRLGESILLGRDPLDREPIDGLFTDAFTLVAEVIESNQKPSVAWGEVHQTAFGPVGDAWSEPVDGRNGRFGHDGRDVVIVALGRQDVDPAGLEPPAGFALSGASSDHLVMAAPDARTAVGSELRFRLDYSALVRAMTSPFVTRDFRRTTGTTSTTGTAEIGAERLRPPGTRVGAPHG